MSLVHHQQSDPLRLLDRSDVQPKQLVAQNQHLAHPVGLERNERFQVAQSVGFVSVADHDALGLGGFAEPLVEFLGPVGDEAGGTDDEEAMVAAVAVVGEDGGDGHEGLAKTHFIRKHRTPRNLSLATHRSLRHLLLRFRPALLASPKIPAAAAASTAVASTAAIRRTRRRPAHGRLQLLIDARNAIPQKGDPLFLMRTQDGADGGGYVDFRRAFRSRKVGVDVSIAAGIVRSIDKKSSGVVVAVQRRCHARPFVGRGSIAKQRGRYVALRRTRYYRYGRVILVVIVVAFVAVLQVPFSVCILLHLARRGRGSRRCRSRRRGGTFCGGGRRRRRSERSFRADAAAETNLSLRPKGLERGVFARQRT
mmetsp:Transcript_33439/g.70291  ORF Transcript_33439/g.70291 Transcript_33439/m.70291 type:complete len:366 (+) Transcript_33439:1549-2646(+)